MISKNQLCMLSLSSVLLLSSCQLFKKNTADGSEATIASKALAQPTAPKTVSNNPTNLPTPGPIDLTSLENPDLSTPVKKAQPATKKPQSPFRVPDATKKLVGETEANRVAISPSIKKLTAQEAEDQSTLVARPPQKTP